MHTNLCSVSISGDSIGTGYTDRSRLRSCRKWMRVQAKICHRHSWIEGNTLRSLKSIRCRHSRYLKREKKTTDRETFDFRFPRRTRNKTKKWMCVTHSWRNRNEKINEETIRNFGSQHVKCFFLNVIKCDGCFIKILERILCNVRNERIKLKENILYLFIFFWPIRNYNNEMMKWPSQ